MLHHSDLRSRQAQLRHDAPMIGRSRNRLRNQSNLRTSNGSHVALSHHHLLSFLLCMLHAVHWLPHRLEAKQLFALCFMSCRTAAYLGKYWQVRVSYGRPAGVRAVSAWIASRSIEEESWQDGVPTLTSVRQHRPVRSLAGRFTGWQNGWMNWPTERPIPSVAQLQQFPLSWL